MALLVGDRLLFLVIPKVASAWIRAVLPKAGLKVAVSSDEPYAAIQPPPSRLAFCLVRHPANWLKSMWMQMATRGVEEGLENSPARVFTAHFRPGASFSDYVENILRTEPHAISMMFDEYERHCWMSGRVEDLPDGLCHILEAAQLSFKKKVIENWHRENVTDHRLRERTRFGQYQRERLMEAEAEFCKKWDYR